MFHESTFASGAVAPFPFENPQISVHELAFRTLVEFKAHPHINNVLTHVSGGQWGKVEEALRFILDPSAEGGELSQLARNILDLMCADRGVTGRILKPRLHGHLYRTVEPRVAVMLIWRITVLFLGLEWTAQPFENRAGPELPLCGGV